MKKKDIKQMLKTEIEQNVPDVLPKVLSTPVKVEEFKKETSPDKKPYFQFRYLYLSLVMCAILVIGIGFFLPGVKSNNVLTPDATNEEYTITTTIGVEDYTANIVTNNLNNVLSISILHNDFVYTLQNANNLTDAITKVINYLQKENALQSNSSITLAVLASINDKTEQSFNEVKTSLQNVLESKGLIDVEIKY